MAEHEENNWVEDENEDLESEDFPIEYSITSSPNDFNIKTLYDFMEKGVIKIPGFQRNYVWDIKRASKLIESIIMGLPIPQIFLYEKNKNDFLVIDGQQRLMTIYYFIKKRFPKDEKRIELRKIFDQEGKIPDKILQDNSYFIDFNLKLPMQLPDRPNRLDGLNYLTLDEQDKMTFELRTIRNVIIKQHSPPNNDSSMYEIFYRLNTGGVNLKPQEIRASLYHSKFYEMLYKVNLDSKWRRLTKLEPDLHMKDIEILVRGFAMLIDGTNYKPSLIRFLNNFSENSKSFDDARIDRLKNIFESFLVQCEDLPDRAFLSQSNQFNVSMYEAIFRAVCMDAYSNTNKEVMHIDPQKLETLKQDKDFLSAVKEQTTSKRNVDLRLRRAKEILLN